MAGITAIRASVSRICKGIPTTVVSVGDNSDQDGAIFDALQQYNCDRPRQLTVELLAAEGGEFEFTLGDLVPGWNEAFAVEKIIYAGHQRFASELNPKFWRTFRNTDLTWILRIEPGAWLPSTNLAALLYYTAPHQISTTTSTNTIASDFPNDVEGFCHLAAARCFSIAASYYTNASMATAGQGNVDNQARAGEWSRRAKESMEVYRQVIGQSVSTDSSPRVQWGGRRMTGGGKGQFFWPPSYS